MMYKYFLQSVILYIAIILPPGLRAQLQINPGASLIMDGSANLVLNNTWFINEGNFIAGNGTVQFTGNITTNTFFRSNGSTSFNNIVINKQPIDFFLYCDISVTGTLTMQKGNLWLNSNTLNLGSTGSIIGESEQSHIMGGTITAVRSFKSAPHAVNPGNMGLELTTDVSPGTVFVSRFNEPQTMPNGGNSIARYFSVTATANSNLNAAVRMYYLNADLGSNIEAGLTMWKGSDIASTWLPAGKDAGDTAANWVLASGIDHFNRFTLFNSDTLETIQPPITDTLIYTPPGGSEMRRVSTVIPTGVYPNPVQDHFTLVFFSEQQQNGVISLYDQLGNLLQYKKLQYHAGINKLTWNMHAYAAGTYYLVGNFAKKSIRIIKQ